ncbi:toxin Cry1Ac domain D-VI-related protein [Listeria booriae]|uniref:Bacterial Ig domain-containing protein n=1 Tax=Listeria booriae TaxID=1552123 RepID=A0A7X1CET6_9LIST|nr:toxin Cry1Ac domain D-VI-related protein [Listeria booriae]MBC1561690.1 hypothetical protein [Listeria booriae]
MTSKKTLTQKAVKTVAVAAVAFSVVAQPLSMIVSADEVTPKAERQLLGATQNLVPIALPSFTTSATTTGFEAWSIMQAERKPFTSTIQNLKPEVSAIGATDANGAFTINDTFGTTMKATADNLGFQIIQTKKNVMNYVGVQQAVKTIPGQKYVLEVSADSAGSTGSNEAGAYLSAIDGTSNITLGEAGSYLNGKYTYSVTFTATGTSTNLEILGFNHMAYSNIKLSQYTNLTVGDITTSSTSVTVGTGTANTLVTMIIGGKTYTGTTDASGNVTININRPDPGQAISIKTSTDAIEKTVIDKTAEAGKTAVDALFLNNDQTQGIKNTTTQASIDAAQLEVNRVTNATTKADLQKELDKAQAQLDAKAFNEAATAATNALFVNNDPSKDIKDTTKQADIDAAQAEVNKVTDPTVKADLQKEIDKAQTQLDAKTAETAAEAAATTATDALFVNNDPSKDIKDTVKQADIDAAQAAVNKVTDPTVKADLQKDIDKAQTQLDAKTSEAEAEAAATTATDALFVNNDPSKDIKDTIKQADIDAAQAAVNKVTDPAVKADLQKDIDKAQKELDEKTATTTATTSVDNLFIDNDPTKDIKDTTKQADIDAAQAAVNKVTDPATKADLQKDIDKAQTQLDAKTTEAAAEKAATTSVDNLFINNDPTKDIKNTIKQADIDAAQAAVNKVTDPTVKADLQKDIDKAQTQLDAKTAEKAAEAAAKTATDALFVNNDPSKNIKDTTTQADIDAAQALVNKVTDPTVKAGLQNEINKAQSQLDAVVPVTATAAKYTIGDLYITGTFTGPVTGLSMDVNGKRYYGGDVYSSNGTYRFYAADKGLKAGDVVTMNFYDATKQIKKSITVTVVDPLKVTVADYKVGDKYINATYNNSDVTQVGLVVDGVKYWGGDVANGTVKYYAADKIKSATSVATMNFYDASGNLLASKAIKIEASYAGEIKTANFKVGENNITGTFAGDVKKLAISINGKMYYGGTITPETGSYKFYVLDKKIKATDAVVVYGYDPDGKLLSQKNVTITE